jgi:hypothetical protein
MLKPHLPIACLVLCVGGFCASAKAAKLAELRTVDDEIVMVHRLGGDFGGRNLTRADVYTCDFSDFTGSGAYRLAVEGFGCSPDFTLGRSVYYEPFKTSVRGFFYMRIGEGKDIKPVLRQPRFISGKDPVDFKVCLTTYGPFHPDWKRSGGDQWDNTGWSKYKEPGSPTNPNAWGGHSDATDWDRNLHHISIIWDLLLPYMLSNGKLSDDDCQIRESGNGIPDIIDEALYETDFWLRLRDGKGGYSADPQYYASKGYPALKEWPHGEALWPAPYCYANNEFTPQQSMRGKMCLLAYLYSLAGGF